MHPKSSDGNGAWGPGGSREPSGLTGHHRYLPCVGYTPQLRGYSAFPRSQVTQAGSCSAVAPCCWGGCDRFLDARLPSLPLCPSPHSPASLTGTLRGGS